MSKETLRSQLAKWQEKQKRPKQNKPYTHPVDRSATKSSEPNPIVPSRSKEAKKPSQQTSWQKQDAPGQEPHTYSADRTDKKPSSTNPTERRKIKVVKNLIKKFRWLWVGGESFDAIEVLLEISRMGEPLPVQTSLLGKIEKTVEAYSERKNLPVADQIRIYDSINSSRGIFKMASELLQKFQEVGRGHDSPNGREGYPVKEEFEKYLVGRNIDEHSISILLPKYEDIIEEKNSEAERFRLAERERVMRNWNRAKEIKSKRLLDAFVKCIDEIYQAEYSPFCSAPTPSISDLKLASIWTNIPEFYHLNFESWLKDRKLEPKSVSRSFEFGRCLSARLAERTLYSMYRANGQKAEDIAVTQLSENSSDWTQFDLLVDDNKRVDVKNSRTSFSSKSTYSEHCVPKLKVDRKGQEVVIAGVLSSYRSVEEMVFGVEKRNKNNVTYLGEVSQREISGLIEHFAEPQKFEINFNRHAGGGLSFFPPWIFSYPPEFYLASVKAIANLTELELPDFGQLKKQRYNWIAPTVLSGHPSLTSIFQTSDPHFVRFSEVVSASREKFGISLPGVFLSVLTYFLKVCRTAEYHGDFDPKLFEKVLYHNSSKKKDYPFGVLDPLLTIASLIKSISVLWSTNREIITNYSQFRLGGGLILQGRGANPGDKWQTLVANCGGWIKDGPKCGNYPLVAGKNANCPSCGHLICHDERCGFCSSDCPSERARNFVSMEKIY
jgi:hypothetical protein